MIFWNREKECISRHCKNAQYSALQQITLRFVELRFTWTDVRLNVQVKQKYKHKNDNNY